MTPRWFPIPLTAHHLATGQRHSCYSCYVAIALRDATGQTWNVGCTDARNEDTGQIWRFPLWVQQLIADLDRGVPIAPCTLQLPRRFAPQEEARHE